MADQMSVALFRTKLGERVPPGGSENDTLFTDNVLQEMLDRAGDNEYRALADAWGTKAGLLAEMIDTDETGSTRKYSQLYAHAFKQWQNYEKLGVELAVDLSSGMRVAGAKGFDAFCAETDDPKVTIFPRWVGLGHDVMYDSKPAYPIQRGLP